MDCNFCSCSFKTWMPFWYITSTEKPLITLFKCELSLRKVKQKWTCLRKTETALTQCTLSCKFLSGAFTVPSHWMGNIRGMVFEVVQFGGYPRVLWPDCVLFIKPQDTFLRFVSFLKTEVNHIVCWFCSLQRVIRLGWLTYVIINS